MHQQVRNREDCLLLLVFIKTGQRLGYFVSIAEVPKDIIIHIANIAGIRGFCKKKLHQLSRTGSGHRQKDQARNYLKLKAFDVGGKSFVSRIAKDAAQTKEELADIINIIIEELVRQRFELPGFTTLLRDASQARSTINNRLHSSIYLALPSGMAAELDALLTNEGQWQRIKQEPKKPTNREVRNFLLNFAWLGCEAQWNGKST